MLCLQVTEHLAQNGFSNGMYYLTKKSSLKVWKFLLSWLIFVLIFLWKKMAAIISNVTFSYTFIQSTEVVLCLSLGASKSSPIFPQKPIKCPFSELCHMPIPTPSTEKGAGLQWFLYGNRYYIYPQTLVTWESTWLQEGRKSQK